MIFKKKQKYYFFDDLKKIGDVACWHNIKERPSIRTMARKKGMLVSCKLRYDENNNPVLKIVRTK